MKPFDQHDFFAQCIIQCNTPINYKCKIGGENHNCNDSKKKWTVFSILGEEKHAKVEGDKGCDQSVELQPVEDTNIKWFGIDVSRTCHQNNK